MTGLALHLLDILLVTVLAGLAWATLTSRDPRRGAVLFIAFGLVLALVWARLAAPDVAIAEAAIGAGLSGALLLAAARDEGASAAESRGPAPAEAASRSDVAPWVLDLLCLGFASVVAWAFVGVLAGADSERLAGQVLGRLPESGVTNPVTAVLLNFRAYDTLLELAVLLVALLGILALGPERAPYAPAEPVLAGLVRWLIPILILTGGYLLWVGAHAPGGAFQAGAVLAAGGVLLRLAGNASGGLPRGVALRLLSLGGVAVFVAIGLAMLANGRPFLGFPPDWAGVLILLIETAATLAIAVALILGYIGGRLRPLADGARPQGAPAPQERDP
jgi:multisubunit Na+/H+ antiporter MnhB subunit